MVSALVFDRVVLVPVLAEVIAMCSWERQSTLTVPLPTQVCKWVPVNLMLGVALQWTNIPKGLTPQGIVEILLIATCYGNWDTLPDGPFEPTLT